MPKRIVVGVGGTGLEVLRCLRRRIVESDPTQGLDKYPNVGFLYVDTDPKEIQLNADNRERWEVLTTSIALQESEFVTIQAPSIGQILDNLSAYPQIQSWLPVEQLKGMNVAARDTPGAQAIRALGRAILTLNAKKVQEKFTGLLGSRANQVGEPVVYLACSISGGTGGGMFLDLAYLVKEWLNNYGRVVGFLILPDLNEESTRGVRYLANSYAALLDLNYFSLRQKRYRGQDVEVGFRLPGSAEPIRQDPFDYTYLVGNRNQADIELGLSTLPDMVAHRIYLSWDNAIAGDVEGMMNNSAVARTQYLTDPFDGNSHAQSFSSFGLSSIRYPTEQITEMIAYKLVEALFARWKQSRTVDNLAEKVSAAQAGLLLADEYLMGNKDFFGQGEDHPPIATQVKADVEREISLLPKDNKSAILRRNHAEYFNSFRGGVTKYYRARQDNLDGAAAVVVRKVRAQVCRTIVDPAMGLPSALAEVDELVRLLTVKRKSYADAQTAAAPKVKATGTSLDASFGQLTQAENALIFSGSKTSEALQRISVVMPVNRQLIIESNAYEYGQKLLDAIIARLGELKQQLSEAGTFVQRSLDKIETEIASRAGFLTDLQRDTHRFNGLLLFDSSRVEQVFAALDRDQALLAVQNAMLSGGEGKDVLQAVHPDGGKGGAEDAADSLDRAYRGAIDWLKRNVDEAARKNVADQLVESYPERSTRIAEIASNLKRARPFVKFSLDQMQAYQGQPQYSYATDGTKDASLIGLMDDHQKRHLNVAQVAQDILAAGARPKEIRMVSDTNQIIFVSETSAFPLRLVQDIAQLRQRYQNYLQKEGDMALPLMIQREYIPPVGDLFLVSEREKEAFEIAQEAFLVGWAEGCLVVETDTKENREEIRLRYKESEVSKYVPLGTDWEAAFAYWMSDGAAAAKIRSLGVEQLKIMVRELQTQRDRAAMVGRLYGLLDALAASFAEREQDDRYERWNRIRLRLVRRYRLLHDGESVTPVSFHLTIPGKSRVPPVSAEVNEAMFLKFVEVAFNSGQGTLSAAMSAMLGTKARRLGIGEDRAQHLIASVGPPPDDGLADYRETLRAFLETGPLTDEAQALLVEMQVERGLSAANVRVVEAEEYARLSRKPS